MALVSLVVVCASIAIFADLYASADHQRAVIIVTETIEQGQLITGSQLGEATASISGGVVAIPVADASELSGHRAAVTIEAGSLLTPEDVTIAAPIASGDAVVGLALKAGQLPAAGVEPGDQVQIVQTASPGTPLSSVSSTSSASGSQSSEGGGSATGVLVPQATVFDVEVPSSNSSSGASLLVSVEVSSTLAASVSTAAAADQISLVLLPSSPSPSPPSSPPARSTGHGAGVRKSGSSRTTAGSKS